jgi:hypothetical protein
MCGSPEWGHQISPFFVQNQGLHKRGGDLLIYCAKPYKLGVPPAFGTRGEDARGFGPGFPLTSETPADGRSRPPG